MPPKDVPPKSPTMGEEEQDQQREQKEPSEPVQAKQLRRVAQRVEMPTDKAQLIQFLSDRIKQAQEALADTEQLLEEQVKEREKVEKSLDERNAQLSKLYEVDQRALPEKIKEKLNQILTMTVTQKIEAEQKLNEEKTRNYEFKCRYDQIKWEDLNNKAKISEQQSKELLIAQQIESLTTQNKTTEDQLEERTLEFSQLKDKKQTLENQYLQMKVALERMADIKGVLNRFFGNQDLFDQKMGLKQQKIVRPTLPQKDTPLPPSRDKSRQGQVQGNTQKLKPISRIKNDDDDFWKGDFKSRGPTY